MSRSIISAIGEAVPGLLPGMQRLVRPMVAHRVSRRCLNAMYSALPAEHKVRFHGYFQSLFSEDQLLESGFWRIKFAGKKLVLPLTADRAWQEWNSALSILGTDLEVKTTYANLLRWKRPHVFFDIGANYGLHSLLFLLHGVRTVSFEPNPSCHGYLTRACQLNGLECWIQGVALSDAEGWTELWYPDRETWSGTTDDYARASLEQRFELKSTRAERTTLDRFVAKHGCYPDLIKVDTEGSELEVLRGGRETLRSCCPLIIFESLQGSRREELISMLAELAYRISLLPFDPRSQPKLLDARAFLESSATNFLAVATNVGAKGLAIGLESASKLRNAADSEIGLFRS